MKKKYFLILFFIIILFIVYFKYVKESLIHTKISETQEYLLTLYNKFNNRFEQNYNNIKLGAVDKIYCISMPQRKKYITDKMNELNVNYALFNAITPDDLTTSECGMLSNINDSKSKIHNKKTRLALQLSFTMCFLDAIKNGYEYIIVFEDDIVINVDAIKLNKSIIEFKKTDYSMFYMGYCFARCGNIDRKINNVFFDVKDKNILCCHAICYKVSYLPSLIKYLYPMENNFDELIVLYNKKNNIKVCVTEKTFFDQNRKELGTLNEDTFTGDNLQNCNNYFIKK